jgi:hypothetical protein
VRMGNERCVCRVLVGKPERKRPLGRPRSRWEDNIKMDLHEVGWGGYGLDWSGLALAKPGNLIKWYSSPPQIKVSVTFSLSVIFLYSSTLVSVNDVRDAVGIFGESRKHLNILLGQTQGFLECCGRWRVWLSPL